MTLFLPPLDTLILFVLLTVRIGAIVLSLPFLGARMVPSQLKVLCVLLLSFGLFPAIQGQAMAVPQSYGILVLLVLGEVFVGLAIGFVTQILFVGIQLSGMVVSQQMGLSTASIFDPQNSSQSSIVSNFQYVLAVLIFFSVSAHHWFIFAMAESLHRIPLLELTLSKSVVMSLVTLLGNAFVTAVKMAAPMLAILVFVTVGLGIVARLVPQLNVFILSFPVNMGTGLLALSVALFYLSREIRFLYEQLGRDLVLVIRLLGEG